MYLGHRCVAELLARSPAFGRLVALRIDGHFDRARLDRFKAAFGPICGSADRSGGGRWMPVVYTPSAMERLVGVVLVLAAACGDGRTQVDVDPSAARAVLAQLRAIGAAMSTGSGADGLAASQLVISAARALPATSTR
jgi:hypothetical protein